MFNILLSDGDGQQQVCLLKLQNCFARNLELLVEGVVPICQVNIDPHIRCFMVKLSLPCVYPDLS